MAVHFYLSPKLDKQDEAPIRVSIAIRGARLISTAGYSIAPSKWNKEDQHVKKGCYNADQVPYNVINARLKKIDSHFSDYEIHLDHRPTKNELADQLASVKGTKARHRGTKDVKTALDYFDLFVLQEGRESQWSEGTQVNWTCFKKHLQKMGDDALLSDFDNDGLARFLDILRNRSKLSEVSVQKEYKHLRWFLRWCIRKGYTDEDAIIRYKPKFRVMPKPVIFLTKEELIKLYHYEIPTKGTVVKLKKDNGEEYDKEIKHEDGLNRARDLFCFCCFTSLRYSDAVALKRSDIVGDYIKIVTKKTNDALEIDINDYAREILDKYKDEKFPEGLALPVISNQKMNHYLKDLGELCGFSNPITRVCYRGGERVEETFPKYALIGTHAGRRTFICFALSSGIPPQVVMKWTGHSDYKAMKPYIDIAEKTKANAMNLFEMELKK